MATTQSISRINFAEREVDRYQEDVNAWKPEHDPLNTDFWIWEDLVAKANFIFGRILELDTDIQEGVLTGKFEFDEEADVKVRDLLRQWSEVSVKVLQHVVQLEKLFGDVEGAQVLRANMKQAQSMLTPDSEFFNSEQLVELRDAAIEAHRSGQTEPLHGERGGT